MNKKLLPRRHGATEKSKKKVLTPEDAIASTQLPGDFHKDPTDRIIISLARRLAVPLVTCDREILDYPHVITIW